MRRSFKTLLLSVLAPSACRSQGLVEKADGETAPLWGLTTLIQGGSSPICNGTFADANATAFYSYNPNVAQGPQAGQPDNYSGKTLPASLALTVQNAEGSGNDSGVSSSYTLWYNTGGANYSDKYALGYDVCALVGFSLNYNTQLRGQSDNGSCQAALDQPCISAIKRVVTQYATWLTTASPGPNSNLTRTSLPAVCRQLSHELVANFPEECDYFFQEKLDGLAYPLTSYGNNYQTGLTPNCTMNGTYQNTLTFYNNASRSIYSAWVDSVTPVIGVWMPIADSAAQTTITQVVAEMFCGRITTIRDGSFVPPKPPQPTPVAYRVTTNSTVSNSTTASNGTTSSNSTISSTPTPAAQSGISGGAIAGIVIGVLAALAILAGILFFFLRKRKGKQQNALQAEHEHPHEVHGHSAMAEVDGRDARYELGEESKRAQLPATMGEGGKGLYKEPEYLNKEPVELPTPR